MDIAEVLKLADELLFTHTGDRLDHLQETIIKGTLQGQKYAKIASENHLSEGHVRDTASELWLKLSDVLGEDVNKLNARNILEKIIISNSGSIGDFIGGNKVSICSERRRPPKSSPLSKPTANKPYLDIDTAPEITAFYGRTDELNTLKNWLIQDCPRLITLVGIIGIGKTTLAIKLIEEIQTQFEYIVYRSLRYCPNIDSFLIDLLQSFVSPTAVPNTRDRQVDLLLKFLRKHRTLIIIDDVQMLFEKGQFSGQYRAECEGYYLLFKQIAELSHASSLLLITSEQPENAICHTARYAIATRHKFTRCLKLTGLGNAAKQILRDKELSDEQMWDTLIENYCGHPLWLEMTATMIQDLFAGSVTEFLSYPSSLLSNEIGSQLSRGWLRLTESEKQIVNYLSKQEKAVTLMQVLQEMPNSYSPEIILNAVRSLKRRCFLEDNGNGERASLLRLDRIWEAYVRSLNVLN
ncbi:AAA family ATPase [Argonema antarcticum A004/B2]|nr:AAA family ATPase [Argonema antarcticum A004/B2]